MLVCIPDGLERQAYAAELTRRGFVTVTADVIGFEDRNWSGDQNISWFELSSRLVQGRTLLGDELQEIFPAPDRERAYAFLTLMLRRETG